VSSQARNAYHVDMRSLMFVNKKKNQQRLIESREGGREERSEAD